MALAGFTVGEAEGLRRAMSRKRCAEALEALRERFVEGALANGVDEETAHRVYDKLAGFSGFGFPKSHSVAFALLAYQSAWLRRYYPAEFLCALMNAQPMGFYPPARLVRDGQRRGVEVIPPDVNLSDARCVIRDGAVIVGLGYVRSVGEEEAETVAAEREPARPDVRDLAQRAPLTRRRWRRSSRRAPATVRRPRRGLLWELGLVPRARRRRLGRGGAPARAAARADRARRPTCPSRPTGSGCSPTTAARASRSASTRSSCSARTCPPARWQPRPAELPHGRRSPSPAWSSPASGPRRPTASSSCCSRTSTGRST